MADGGRRRCLNWFARRGCLADVPCRRNGARGLVGGLVYRYRVQRAAAIGVAHHGPNGSCVPRTNPDCDLRAAFVVALQHALLPKLPSPPGVDVAARYLPAENDLGLGGDWYDVFTASPARVGVIVGDVCGHGIQAAATMALLRGTLNALVRQNHTNLTDVFANAEAWLVAEPDFVATVAVHVVDTDNDTLHYLSAGHPPSVLVLPDGSCELLEAARRPVLGISGPTMPNGRLRFPAGAILVACTDGLLERRDRTLDEGLTTVARIATEHRRGTAEDIVAALEKSIDISPSDDIAFVVLKRTDIAGLGSAGAP